MGSSIFSDKKEYRMADKEMWSEVLEGALGRKANPVTINKDNELASLVYSIGDRQVSRARL